MQVKPYSSLHHKYLNHYLEDSNEESLILIFSIIIQIPKFILHISYLNYY